MSAVPAIGDWLMPRGDDGVPGMVVDILPSGSACVLARYLPPTYQMVETAHNTADLKGPMMGRKIL